MRKTLITLTVLALAASGPAMAGKASKAENVGVGSGAAIGAAAGGPIGFIVGAAIGAKIGERIHKKNEKIETLNASLDVSRNDVSQLQRELRSLDRQLDTAAAELVRLNEQDGRELVGLMQAGVAMDLLFRTDEHALTDTTGDRLAQLATTVAGLPDIHVQLDGYADERGDAEYNLALSRKRADFVREQLVDAGIDPARIHIAAHGEAPAQDDTIDSLALERRVSLTLFIDSSPSVAANPAPAH